MNELEKKKRIDQLEKIAWLRSMSEAEISQLNELGMLSMKKIAQRFNKASKETRKLLEIPGMRESIKDGMAEDVNECSQELKW